MHDLIRIMRANNRECVAGLDIFQLTYLRPELEPMYVQYLGRQVHVAGYFVGGRLLDGNSVDSERHICQSANLNAAVCPRCCVERRSGLHPLPN